jgi:3-deoxy-7-phosphoheptulonate synthase
VEALKEQVAKAQRGEAFVLQGGDCAESFDDCTSESIVAKLKILLQMSLVMLHGLKKPVVRIGRMAGQYAKPRSADTETREGTSLPSFPGGGRQWRHGLELDGGERRRGGLGARRKRCRGRRASAELYPTRRMPAAVRLPR